MARKPRIKYDYKRLPEPVKVRSGIKVGWYYYADEETAKKAGVLARHNAEIDANLGYDFGYCAPGSVRLIREGEYAGLWEVCHS